MLIREAKDLEAADAAMCLMDCVKLSRTLAFRRKYDAARRRVEEFLRLSSRPVISCGGGKDSTAISIIARAVDGSIPILCADPPNPLTDREAHVRALLSWLGGDSVRIPYDWDVQSVLRGEKPYPEGLKMRTLSRWHKEHGIDGVILGIRASESKMRRLNLAQRGFVYPVHGGYRCQPIADMSAAEVLCVALLHDAPVNPVYTKQAGVLNFDHIRDGTWWPHGKIDNAAWIRRYYPEFYEPHMAAKAVYKAERSLVCAY